MTPKDAKTISRNTTVTLGLMVAILGALIPATWVTATWAQRQTTRQERMEEDLKLIKQALENAGIPVPEWSRNFMPGWVEQKDSTLQVGREHEQDNSGG